MLPVNNSSATKWEVSRMWWLPLPSALLHPSRGHWCGILVSLACSTNILLPPLKSLLAKGQRGVFFLAIDANCVPSWGLAVIAPITVPLCREAAAVGTVRGNECCLLGMCCGLHLWVRTRGHCNLPGEWSHWYRITLSVQQASSHKELLIVLHRIFHEKFRVIEIKDVRTAPKCAAF